MSINSSDSSFHLVLNNCLNSRMTMFIFISILIQEILFLLPLLFLVLYVGLQRWWKQSSSSTATMSHSDFFTYHMVAMNLISITATCLYCFGFFSDSQNIQQVGNSIFFLTSPGQTLLHLLTCLEPYLAVVHPITYQGLKQVGGLRMRNIITGTVWLLCLGIVGLTKLFGGIFYTATNSCLLIFFLFIVSFCSISVLRVLNHPGPGQVSGVRERVDQSKQRAFHTIMVILVAQVLRCVGVLLYSVMSNSSLWSHTVCLVGTSFVWLTEPDNLVLPLLFLHRAGKLPGCSRR